MREEEDDPDWLTAFQAPSASFVMLSSSSDGSPENSPTRTTPSGEGKQGDKKASSENVGDGDAAAQNKGKKKIARSTRRKNTKSQEDASDKHEGSSMEEKQDKPPKRLTPKRNLVTPSFDSDASPGNSPSRTGEINEEDKNQRLLDQTLVQIKQMIPWNNKNMELTRKRHRINLQSNLCHFVTSLCSAGESWVNPLNKVSQRLPLIIPDKVQRSKALIECDGDSIDLSGDIGAVGRIVISNGPTGNQDLLLDLKGTIYKSTIVPSRTFCVVSVGQTEAKIESIMNDFIQLEPQSNLFEAETMMEGTLDGFTFDSDEEGDKLPESHAAQNDQNNQDDDQPKGKNKRKAEKPAGKGQKKAKVAGKAPKKGTRKTQSTKRTKKAKK
ncbi:hypothetical protein GUJ93_ZPchr0002g26701 [Zizania palustris]|uniref:DNA-binding protein BIN4 n=1 Tax=Zizania palustris TaxID=103762 RepID=A0A8J5RF15_ZIZPA|nr:hypothetical protein GUJ93_ZPchr0002g26701 [Zizania palustris]